MSKIPFFRVNVVLLAFTLFVYVIISTITSNIPDMSALARIEIAASPEVVRRVFLDFPNWSKIKDPVISSVAPVNPSSPIVPGSKLHAVFAGHKAEISVTENTPQTFSWRTELLYIMAGNRKFSFLPSGRTKGHTTFVNEEKFERFFWVLVATGVMKEQKAFETFNARFKSRVDEVVGGAE